MLALIKRRQLKRLKREHSELRQAYPSNGNCPVYERTGDGYGVGRCEFSLRGDYCPRHGDLSGRLVASENSPHRWQTIDENELPPPDRRLKAPEELFVSEDDFEQYLRRKERR